MHETMPQPKVSTRDRLLDLAEKAVLQKGFGATSIEELVTGVGITKSGFFYHFKDKSDLAKALLHRHFVRDDVILDGIFGRARELHDDPLHSFLIGLKLFAEMLDQLPQAHPGCLVASFCYQEQLFNREIRELNAKGVLAWRARFRDLLDEIVECHPPRAEVDLDALADMLSTLVEGGIVMTRALKEPRILAEQIMLYRVFIRSLFAADD
jgi:TetR/AcrR family transcriptional repressor of nem operon